MRFERRTQFLRHRPHQIGFPAAARDESYLVVRNRYAGASDSTLQEIRYLREGVFLKDWTAETAAKDALDRKKGLGGGPAEDRAAFENLAADMR